MSLLGVIADVLDPACDLPTAISADPGQPGVPDIVEQGLDAPIVQDYLDSAKEKFFNFLRGFILIMALIAGVSIAMYYLGYLQ